MVVLVLWVGEGRQLNRSTGQRILGRLKGMRWWNINVVVVVVVQRHGGHYPEGRHGNNERLPP